MRSLNKIQLIGRVGMDPDVKTVGDGVKVATFTVAVNERYRSNGEQVERTDWFRVEVWRGLADVVEQYLKKGDLIYVEGRVKTDVVEKDGRRITYYTVVGRDLIFLGSPSSGESSSKEAASVTENVKEVTDELPDDVDDLPF